MNRQEIFCKNCGTGMIFPLSSSHRENHCPRCNERVCAKCGCSENAACLPPCYWSFPGECSACYFAVNENADRRDARVINEPEPVLNEFFDPEAGDAVAVFFTADRIENLAPFYFPPHWRNETSGALKRAVKSYSAHVAKGAPPPSPEEIKLIHRYFRAYVFAPVWNDTALIRESLGELRRRADREFKTCREIGDFLSRCAMIGLEPF